MADATNIENSADAQTQDTDEAAKTFTAEQFNALQEELAATKVNLERSRKGEKFNQSKRHELETQLAGFESQVKSLMEEEDYKAKYEASSTELNKLKTEIREQQIDTVLTDELTKANARSVSTVMKLVDRSKINVVDGQVDTKSVEELINELKKTDQVLFQEVNTPTLKRPGESTPVASYKGEMSAAKTPAEVQKVLAKYGMGSTI